MNPLVRPSNNTVVSSFLFVKQRYKHPHPSISQNKGLFIIPVEAFLKMFLQLSNKTWFNLQKRCCKIRIYICIILKKLM